MLLHCLGGGLSRCKVGMKCLPYLWSGAQHLECLSRPCVVVVLLDQFYNGSKWHWPSQKLVISFRRLIQVLDFYIKGCRALSVTFC